MGARDDINQIESAYRSTCISKADHDFSYGDRENLTRSKTLQVWRTDLIQTITMAPPFLHWLL
jgi:hypothetical protein